MALEIKAIPTLHGEDAKRFLELAEASPETRKARKRRIRVNLQDVKTVLHKAGML